MAAGASVGELGVGVGAGAVGLADDVLLGWVALGVEEGPVELLEGVLLGVLSDGVEAGALLLGLDCADGDSVTAKAVSGRPANTRADSVAATVMPRRKWWELFRGGKVTLSSGTD